MPDIKKILLFPLILGIAAGLKPEKVPQTLDDAKNTASESEVSFIRSFMPFFGPVDIDNENNNFKKANDSNDLESVDISRKSPEPIIVIVREFIIEDANENSNDLKFPGFEHFFENDGSLDDNIGVLDLSGKNMNGDDLAFALRSRQLLDQPVTTLILSNSRITGLTSASFLPAESTLEKLVMDNSTVSLEALTRLSNLRILNLSNCGLSTFQWYPQLRDSLEVLDLSHNHLSEIRPELSVLGSLRHLNLSYNQISAVNEYPLVMLPNLEVISLTMNSLSDASFTSLHNLQRVDLDWNFLRLCGENLQLPSHTVSLKLASNPWRCDCGLLEARDIHNVLDIDILRCANRLSYSLCNGCQRYFLPIEEYNLVGNLTKDSINHLGCTGLVDQYYLVRDALIKLKENEPYKLVQLGVMLVLCVVLGVAAVLMCRNNLHKKKFTRKTWLPSNLKNLKISKLENLQEIPYIKIDEPKIKA